MATGIIITLIICLIIGAIAYVVLTTDDWRVDK